MHGSGEWEPGRRINAKSTRCKRSLPAERGGKENNGRFHMIWDVTALYASRVQSSSLEGEKERCFFQSSPCLLLGVAHRGRMGWKTLATGPPAKSNLVMMGRQKWGEKGVVPPFLPKHHPVLAAASPQECSVGI